MKKLMFAAVVAASMVATADEPKCEGGKCELPKAAEAVATVPAKSAQMTDEPRQAMRERVEKFKSERRAAMEARRAEQEAKKLEIVKKYVPEEEKAKALLAELQEAMRPQRRLRPMAQKLDAAPAPAPAADAK